VCPLGITVSILHALLLVTEDSFDIKVPAESKHAVSYEDAVSRIQTLQDQELASPGKNLDCISQLLTHGKKTDNAILFLHGFTTCPKQFEKLGQEFFSRGWNVFIPCMPRHGYTDRLGKALEGLSVEELTAFADEVVEISRGLGENVKVTGLSGGGTIAVWLAQMRPDVTLVVAIAPFVGIGFIPSIFNRAASNLLRVLPNMYHWLDPLKKDRNPLSAPYQYTRYPSHALACFLRLGFMAYSAGRKSPPSAERIVIITNARDKTVNRKIITQFVNLWKAHDHAVTTYELPAALNQPHDIISPGRPDNDIRLTYPILMDLILESNYHEQDGD
jgi:carboxylesterase